jgi:transcriptional regulator with XRE-family HTH domain
MKPLADQVRDHMRAKGLSKKAMAEAAGTSRQNIDGILSGAVKQPHYIKRLAAAMGTNVDALLGGGAGPAVNGVDAMLMRQDGSMLCIELKNVELDDTTLSAAELQDLVAAAVDMPGAVARQWLAKIASDAAVYREHEARVIRRLGGAAPAPRGVIVRAEQMRRAQPPRPPIGEISAEALRLVRALQRISDPIESRRRQAQALQVLDGNLDALLSSVIEEPAPMEIPRARAAKVAPPNERSTPAPKPAQGRRR